MAGIFSLLLSGAIGFGLSSVLGGIGYSLQKIVNVFFPHKPLPEDTLTDAFFRGKLKELTPEEAVSFAAWVKLEGKWDDLLKEISQFGYDPKQVQAYLYHMRELGYNPETIKEFFYTRVFYPSADDLIRFGVREAFRSDIAAKYGYDEENPAEISPSKEFMIPYLLAQGFSPEVFKLFWRAHWVLPSPTQAFEMLQRLHPDQLKFKTEDLKKLGLTPEEVATTVDEVSDLLKIADIPIYWRKRFLPLVFTPITRVDIRRFEDLGLMSDEELEFRYREIGYSPEDAKKLVTFTKVLNRKDEFRAALIDGSMTVEDLENELRKLGVPEEGIKRWVKVIVPKSKREKMKPERDLTKTEIIKGVKAGVITEEQAIDYLMHLGYDRAEAEYIVAINLMVAKGDPETPLEMRRVVELQKKAMGLPYVEITQEMIELEKKIMELKKRMNELLAQGKQEEASDLAVQINDLEYRLKQLLVSHGVK
jgi:hypothetical protein